MDRDAKYVAVGAFVLLALVMGAVFVFWYTDTGDRRDSQRYEIYFRGSVSGLSEGSSVRYLGVAVGRVVRIDLDPRDPGRVRVLADIAEDTPIKQDTVARLQSQGVTGLLFVDLKPHDPKKPQLRPVAGIDNPVIPSEQSDMHVFVSSLPEVIASASEVLNRINELLSDHNIEMVTGTLGGIEVASRELPGTVTEARALFAELRGVAAEIQSTSVSLRELSASSGEQIKVTVVRMREVADNVAKTTARLDRFVEANEGNLDRFAGQGLAEFEQLARETRQAVHAIKALSESLERDPSRLIYRPAPSGVEIPQ